MLENTIAKEIYVTLEFVEKKSFTSQITFIIYGALTRKIQLY